MVFDQLLNFDQVGFDHLVFFQPRELVCANIKVKKLENPPKLENDLKWPTFRATVKGYNCSQERGGEILYLLFKRFVHLSILK